MVLLTRIKSSLNDALLGHRWYSSNSAQSIYKWYYRKLDRKSKINPEQKGVSTSITDNALFTPFTFTDSVLLEKNYKALRQKNHDRSINPFMKRVNNMHHSKVYLLYADLYFCDLQTMVMKPIYWGESNDSENLFDDVYEIRRGVWLESVNTIHDEDSEGKNNKILLSNKKNQELPIPVYVSEQIEDLFKEDSSHFAEDKLLTIRDKHHKDIIGKIFIQNENTIFHIPKEQLVIYDNALTLKLIKQNIFTVGLKKYIKQKPTEQDELEKLLELESFELSKKKKIHLTFCVHGIGQILGSKYEYVNFPKTISFFRENIKKLIKLNKEASSTDEDMSIQVLPITWRNKLDFNHPSNDQELPSFLEICPSGAMTIRSLIGDIGLDILLYDNNYYREQIIEAVITELNDKYNQYKNLHTENEISISLIGHSLGSLIVFDILNEKKYFEKLDFKVVNFFGIGSPVSIFKLVQRYKLSEELYCENYYNIFHECDPIGYRIEPLLDRSLSNIQPIPLPTLSSPDLIIDKVKNIHVINDYLLQLDILSDKNSIKSVNMDGKLQTKHVEKIYKFNTFGRIDYVIKSKLLDLDMINSLKSHVCYFEEYDLINFIIKKLLAKKQTLKLSESLKLNKLA